MKYFAKCVNAKTKRQIFKADISQGCSAPNLRRENAAQALLNFCSDKYPYLKSHDEFLFKQYDTPFIGGVGIYDNKLYYIRENEFYYDNVKYFYVQSGRKKFAHHNEKILIFPDMICFDPQTKVHTPFGKSTGRINYTIMHRTVGTESLGRSCITSNELDLTNLFSVGDKIIITEESGLGISGFHTITEINRTLSTLMFSAGEFGEGETINVRGSLGNGAPDTCDSACVSGGRVWIACKNKIFSSAVNNVHDWATDGKEDDSAFVCNIFDDKITACLELEGAPVFFSESKVYKIYGDNSSNFQLRVCEDWGGVSDDMISTVATVKGKIFYISMSGLACFDGTHVSVMKNLPFELDGAKIIGAADAEKYYICVEKDDTSVLYVYDVEHGFWQDFGEYAFTCFFNFKNALCASDGTKITVLHGHFDMMDEHGYSTETKNKVMASFEIRTLGAKPYKVCIDCEAKSGAVYDFYVSKKIIGMSSQKKVGEKFIGHVLSGFSGRAEFLIVPSACDSITLSLRGTGSITIKNISVEAML